jgi:hypothetical protein
MHAVTSLEALHAEHGGAVVALAGGRDIQIAERQSRLRMGVIAGVLSPGMSFSLPGGSANARHGAPASFAYA